MWSDVPRDTHIPRVNQAAAAHHRVSGALQRAQVVDDAGEPRMSVNALVARLRSCDSAADLAHIADVLATIANSTPTATATPDDRQAGLAEWDRQVATHALATATRPVATNQHPSVAEAQRIDSAGTSQRAIPGYLAAFSHPARPAIDHNTPERRPRPSKPPGNRRDQPGHGIEM